MSESPRNDPNLDSAQQPPSYNDVTVNVKPEASQEVAVHPLSHNDVTIDAPPDESHDGSAQSGSFNDATIDAPPDAAQAAALQPDSYNDATVDAPPEPLDATSCMTVDHLSTQVKEIKDFEADDSAFTLSGDSGQENKKPKNIIANYEVLGVLGRGAVGVVYKARQLGLNRLVALKMLLAGSHAGKRELMRFRIEAEAVARLRHPNIVQVYEVGEHEGLPFFSLEFVEGGSLHQKMGGKPLPPREGAAILEALARAMYYAHQNNIIHRDLKPANVLLTLDGIPKVTDFGLAKRLEESEESSQTRTGTLMGTPSYMPPEQAEGRTHDIGPVSDQYTLGAILYELLTGRPPFLGATMLETIQQVRTQEPVPPSQLQPATPRDLEVICLKALQKEPGKRYANAGDLADDLRRFLDGEPIHARPVSLVERSWRWCRRNPRLASLYAAVSVLVLLVAISGGILSLRMLREQQAVTRVRDQVEQRIGLAEQVVSAGDVQRAKDLLKWSDPLLQDSSTLSELHDRWQKLNDSIDAYGKFKDLLDKARFAYIFGAGSSQKQLEKGKEYCQELLTLYDAFVQERIHRPALNDEQDKLYKDDVFDMFLVAALIEKDLAQTAGSAQRRQAAQQALNWLDRADEILPEMRTFYARRSELNGNLGNREAADADFKRALAIKPASAIDHFWHGYAELIRSEGARSRGETDKAREHLHLEVAEYASLLQQHPDHFWGYFNWANAKVKLENFQDALIGYTTCIRLRPDFPWPYNNRGTVHLRLKQYDQAIRDYTTALAKNGEYVPALSNRAMAYIEQGKIDLALKDCNLAVEQDPRHAAAYLHRAECYLRSKQYEEALADCTRVLELDAFKDDVHSKREAIYQALKESGDDARFKRALAQDRKKALELYKQAQVHVSRGEYQQALVDYTAIIELLPTGVEPYRDRGVINLLHFKDFNAALIDWRRVIRFWPSKPEAYRLIAMIHLGRRQYDLALQELDDALSRKPGDVEAIWGKAQIYLWQGKTKEALELVNPLVEKLTPEAVETLNIRGDIYRHMGRLQDAAADYRRLIQLRPELPDAYVSLALVYGKQGESAKARQCLDQLVQANPKSETAYLSRGRFLRDQGQFEEAWRDSEQAGHCNPRSLLPAMLQSTIMAARGDASAGVAAAERTLADAPEVRGEVVDGQVLYSAVQVYSIASAVAGRAGDAVLAKRYADGAVELLTRTLDKGFHDLSYHEHNRMIDDPALESIRRLPKAEELLAHRG